MPAGKGYSTRKEVLDAVRVSSQDRKKRNRNKQIPLLTAKQRAMQTRAEARKAKPNILQRAMVGLSRKKISPYWNQVANAMDTRAEDKDEIDRQNK